MHRDDPKFLKPDYPGSREKNLLQFMTTRRFTVVRALRVLLGLQPLITTAVQLRPVFDWKRISLPLRVLPATSGKLCIVIRLVRQNTAAKSLVKPDLREAFSDYQ